jgi:hypothetical protein
VRFSPASEPTRCFLGERPPFCNAGGARDCEAERARASSSGSLDRFLPLTLSASPRGVVPAGLPAYGILVFSVASSDMTGVVGKYWLCLCMALYS